MRRNRIRTLTAIAVLVGIGLGSAPRDSHALLFESLSAAARRAYDGARTWVRASASDIGRRLSSLGAEELQGHFAAAWEWLRSADCNGSLARLFARFDPLQRIGSGFPNPAVCQSDFVVGFLCGVPNAIQSIANIAEMLRRGAVAAIAHRDVCLSPTALAAFATQPALGLAGALGCGLAYDLAPGIQRAIQCFSRMSWRQLGGLLFRTAAAQVRQACQIAGEIALNAAVDVLSGGTGLVASVARLMQRILTLIPGASDILRGAFGAGEHALQIMGRTIPFGELAAHGVDQAQSYVSTVLGSACANQTPPAPPAGTSTPSRPAPTRPASPSRH